MTIKSLSLVTATLLLNTHTFAEEVTLDEITITTATKTTQNISSVTSNVDVITAQEIEDRGFTTVTQALNTLPGISLSSSGGLGQDSSLYVRGMSTNRTLVLIDGVRYNNVTSPSGAAYTHLMIADIAQIEVVKGAQSGIWGADASAGVINIITKKAKSGLHGSAYVEGGSFKTKKYGATLSYATESYNFKVSHDVVDTDGFTAQAPYGEDIDLFEEDSYKNQTTSIELGVNINASNKVELTHTLIDTEGKYDTYQAPDSKAFANTKDTFSSINFHHVDNFNTLNIYAKSSVFDREFIAPNYMGEVETTEFDGEVKEYGINSKIPYGNEDFVLVGFDYKEFEHENEINKDYNNKGVFVTNSNTFNGFMDGKTIFTESLRYDNYSTFDNKLTGKIGLKHIHEKFKGLTTSVNYGTAYNVPTLYQLYSPYGNTSLSTEETKSFDITIAYKDFTVGYFNTKIDDMIDFDMGTYAYANMEGTSKINGIETAYKTSFFDILLLNVNYTHLLTAEDKEGKDLIRRAKDTLNVALDYYGIENLHLGIDAQYVGSRTDTKFNPDYSTSNVQTGKYTVVNLTANYDITKEIKVYGKIENLGDKYYQTVYGYTTSPRAFSLGLKASF